jgi:hypothetical protein
MQMIECEIWMEDRNSVKARFAALPRVGEEVILPDHGKFVVKSVLHFDLGGLESSHPAVKLTVASPADDD